MTGTFIGRTPEFTDPLTSSRNVQFCDTGVRDLTAELSSQMRPSLVLSKGQAIRLER